MMQVKIFARKAGYFTGAERLGVDLETQINAWLGKHPGIKVRNIVQSQSGGSFEPSNITTSIWYDDI